MSEELVNCPKMFNFFCDGECDCPPERLNELFRKYPKKVREFARGETIAFQGAPATLLVMLTEGEVRLEVTSESGAELFMGDRVAPYPICAALLFSTERRYVCDIFATSKCVVEYFSLPGVEELMRLCPHFLRGFLKYDGDLICDFSRRLQIFSIRKIKGKLAYYILQIAEASGFFEFKMSVTSLASYFGVTRSALSRVIAELVSEETITYTQGYGTILSYKRLLAEI